MCLESQEIYAHTQSLATNFPAFVAHFVPGAVVQLVRAVSQLAGQGDDFSNDKFRNTSRVCERGVENCNTVSRGIFEIDLVCSDAEAADDNQVLGFPKNRLRELCFRSNTDNMDVTILADELARCSSHLGPWLLAESSRSVGPRATKS